MPQEKDRQDQEVDSMIQQNSNIQIISAIGQDEADHRQQPHFAIAPSQASAGSRMGGRIGARMDGLRRAGEIEAD